jgi:Na+/H+ antiporter NhaD/arsenite permease-like protein
VVVPAILIFAATYVVMAVGRLPGYRMDRAGAALLGASLMVAFGVLTPDEAYAAVDMETIALLLGMMIVVANLRLSGFFRLVIRFAIARAGHPLMLLAAIVILSGVLSAFLVNDAICLVMTPLVLDLVTRLKRDPVPYLLAVSMASNAGSVATITGNPQNMIIGSLSHIPYATFAFALSPIAVVSLVIAFCLIAVSHREEFFRSGRFTVEADSGAVVYHRPLVIKTVAVLAAMVVLFFAGQPVAKVAIVGGALLLFTRRVNPKKVYVDIDWPLLVMFAGLFIVVAGLDKAVLDADTIARLGRIDLGNVPVLAAITAVLSNLVSNVPAVLVLRPFVERLADPQHAWQVVAMASTLAGNFTIVGSVANLIVVERARARGVEIGFWHYFRVGAPLTMLSIVLGAAWMIRG